MKIARALLAVWMGLLPALSSAASTLATEPPARPTPPPARPAAKVKLTEAEADALVKEMSLVVERIRGLKFKTPVTMKIIDGATAREQFKSKVEPREEEQMHYTQEVYARLGLVPKGTDLLKDYLHLAEEGVDGYYEPGSKTFYLLDHVALDGVRAVMVHELTHALEDQYYDLKSISKLAGGDDDRSTAIASLIEGSAMVVTLAYMDKATRKGKSALRDVEGDQSKRADKIKTAPSFTQRSLLMPYVLGFSFLLRGHLWNWMGGGVLMSDLDYAYAHPPLSTHHIIHPGLYWQRPDIKYTPPRLPDLSPMLGDGWKKATEGSIGELGLAVLTGTTVDFSSPRIILPESWSNSGAAATAGDVYQHYANGDKRVTVLVTGWQDVPRARAFQRALKLGGDRTDFILGASHLVFLGDVGGPDKALALAQAAFEGYRYWPHDEGVTQWPPARGPEMGLD